MKPKLPFLHLGIIGLLLSLHPATATVYYVNASNTAPASPFADWASAATNIQDAIDLTTNADTVLVTNGVYAFGGRIMAGDLLNRVALTNAITVQSVNGPWVTTILGTGATNGAAAVRCAWLTNGASLIGFTLTAGATRNSGDTTTLESGGGVWCCSSNAFVGNCVIVSNTAYQYGGGVYQGAARNTLISSNISATGGGAYKTVLNNCTIVSNANYGVANPISMTNCIIYFNKAGDVMGSGFPSSHCCTSQTLTGPGNITSAPQLFADGVHLMTNSPCIGTGINLATGTDIFGQAWSNPPAIGCAEWQPLPVASIPRIQLNGDPIGFTVGSAFSGTPPFSFFWLKDGVPLLDNTHLSGTHTANLIASGANFADAGGYQLVVSNSFGMVTSPVVQLTIHCVDINGANPTPPYSTWETAATNIQDAITAAAVGEIVLVTNGLYATGGISMDGVITNRVSVNKAILLQSVNGPNATIIQGAWDPTATNGPGAVRCAWLTTNAIISGFTLRGGATRASGSTGFSMDGGGIWGPRTNTTPVAIAANCVIIFNVAFDLGGGAAQVTLNYCTIASNTVTGGGALNASGGGAWACTLKNCIVVANTTTNLSSGSGGNGGGVFSCNLKNCALLRNSAMASGGGAYQSTLYNCTVVGNKVGPSSGTGGGVSGCTVGNSIVYQNVALAASYSSTSNSQNSTFSYSCTAPAATGTGNIASNPLLLADGLHLSPVSPCIGAGSTSTVSGTDMDGQAWNNPPSMGCDEWQPAPIFATQPAFQIGSPPHGFTCSLAVAGQTPFDCFWTKDGMPIQDDGHYGNSGTPNLVVNNFSPDDAGFYQVVVTNSAGTATSQIAQLVIHAVNAAGTSPAPPYSTWTTAATNIQDAINSASVGDVVLVTNGLYSTGGKVMSGDLTNRLALDKAITVASVNGPTVTVIQGSPTTGPGAVRCAWLADGAVLNGFTLKSGATRTSGDGYGGGPLESGGGIYCKSTNGVAVGCILTNNSANYGGGIVNGTLNNSLVTANHANRGGGAYNAAMYNCTLLNNYATSTGQGGGTYGGLARNSIVLGNYDYPSLANDNFGGTGFSYSSTSPIPSGTGNTNVNPLFMDSIHIASSSPCRGAGSVLYASGTDVDGEPWANPPSMGCDEVVVSNLTGPLSASILATSTNLLVTRGVTLSGMITGRASSANWTFGDSAAITNTGAVATHNWTNAGDYTVTFTVFNNDNPTGVSANTVIHVQPLNPPQMQSAGIVAGTFQFQFPAQTNANYTIQYTTNLSQSGAWQTLQTIYYNTSSTIQISDPVSTNTARFYRVLVQ